MPTTISRFAATLYVIGALLGLLAVALAAAAAHAIADIAPAGARAVEWFKEASAFQINHALALIAATAVSERLPVGRARGIMRAGAVLLTAGAILFPAALYSVSFGGPVFFAPFGGISAMAGWGLFGLGAVLAALRPASET